MLEEFGYDDKAEKLAAKGLNFAGADETNPFVASTALNNIGRPTRPLDRTTGSQDSDRAHQHLARLGEANDLLRTCKSDSQRVTVLVELATENLELGNQSLALQQLDVAQMFLQILDKDRQGDFIKRYNEQTNSWVVDMTDEAKNFIIALMAK